MKASALSLLYVLYSCAVTHFTVKLKSSINACSLHLPG
jgi:hypothetical protein